MQFIDGAKNFWKMYSIWAFAIIAILPDLFNLAVTSGLLTSEETPEILNYILKFVVFVGAASRLVKQKVLEQTPPPQS